MELHSLSTPELAYCVLVLLIAYSLRGSTGFGSVVGMPFLALVIPMKVLVPVWTLLGITSSFTIAFRDRRNVAVRTMLPFLPWCFLGIALGLYVFTKLEPSSLARGLGVLVIAYATYSAFAQKESASHRRLPARGVAPIASLVSGVVGATFGTMATVFMVMYLDTRNLAKDAFRATISTMLLVLSIVRGVGYYAVGEFTREALIVFAAAFPAMLAGIYIGNKVHVRLSESAFRRLIIFLLYVCGIPLLFR